MCSCDSQQSFTSDGCICLLFSIGCCYKERHASAKYGTAVHFVLSFVYFRMPIAIIIKCSKMILFRTCIKSKSKKWFEIKMKDRYFQQILNKVKRSREWFKITILNQNGFKSFPTLCQMSKKLVEVRKRIAFTEVLWELCKFSICIGPLNLIVLARITTDHL